MDAVKIIKDARWRLEVGDITQQQYEELVSPLRNVEVVKPGRWIPCRPLGDGTPEGYMCSVCHVGGWEKTNFCSMCGADMRKDGDHEKI